MKKEFIPYEQALELKELGFDEPCLSYYEGESFSYHLQSMTSGDDYIIPAPLYQQAFRWFRDKKGLHGIYTMGDDWNSFYWQIWRNDTMTKTYVCSSDLVYETYEEAELACLKKLIEIVKNKQP